MCGIGGRTIAEAQQRMSYPEFARWVAYRRKRGPLNLGLRVDRGAAVLAQLYAPTKYKREGGGRFRLSDFMPWADEQPVSLDEAMAEWK